LEAWSENNWNQRPELQACHTVIGKFVVLEQICVPIHLVADVKSLCCAKRQSNPMLS
jgi:hypothetical protein